MIALSLDQMTGQGLSSRTHTHLHTLTHSFTHKQVHTVTCRLTPRHLATYALSVRTRRGEPLFRGVAYLCVLFAFLVPLHRQHGNVEDCFEKLQAMVDVALVKPKKRRLRTGLSEGTKAAYIQAKRARSAVKSSRRGNFDD